MRDKRTARNYFTGKELRTGVPSTEYLNNYDAIFRKDVDDEEVSGRTDLEGSPTEGVGAVPEVQVQD